MFTSSWRSVMLVAGETLLLVTAVILASYLRIGEATWDEFASSAGVLRVFLIVGVCQVCLHYADVYDLRAVSGTQDLIVRLVQALGATSLILALTYFWFPQWVIGRGVFLIAAAFVILLVVAWRFAFRWLSSQVGPRERLLL